MSKHLIYLYLLSVLLIVSCDYSRKEKRTFFIETMEDYPIRSNYNSLIKKELDQFGLSNHKTIISNKSYYRLSTGENSSLRFSGFVRFQNDKLLYLSQQNNKEQVLLDFTAEKGKKWLIKYSNGRQEEIKNLGKVWDPELMDSLNWFGVKTKKYANPVKVHNTQLQYLVVHKKRGFVVVTFENSLGTYSIRIIPEIKIIFNNPASSASASL